MELKGENRGHHSSSLPSNNRNDKRDPQISRRKVVTLALIAIAIVSIYRTFTDNATLESSMNFRAGGAANQATTVDKIADAQKGTTTTITTEEDLFSFDTTWPPIRNALCKNGAPNTVLGSTLFELARQEVFGSENGTTTTTTATTTNIKYVPTRKPNPVGGSSYFRKEFFSGDFTASVFTGFNETGGKFSTIYARIWKCGNNQIRAMEQELFKNFEGRWRDNVGLGKALQTHYRNLYFKSQQKNNSDAPPCIYTAVRDPISHFLSGYNEMEVRLLENKIKGKYPFAPYHWAVPYSKTSPVLQKKRFLAFVEDLLLENQILGKNWVYFHFYPMSRILHVLGKHNTNLTGYINGLESLTSTWPDFMASTCGGELGFPSRERLPVEMKLAGQHDSSNDALGLYKAAKEVWAEQGPIARALCVLHAFDYACFPNLPEPIPAICRSVYEDHSKTIVENANQTIVSKTERDYKAGSSKSVLEGRQKGGSLGAQRKNPRHRHASANNGQSKITMKRGVQPQRKQHSAPRKHPGNRGGR